MINGHFESQKHAYRQTKNGTIVSFILHPNDVDPSFATAPLGTRFMIGYQEMDDNEIPGSKPSLMTSGEGGGGEGNDLPGYTAPTDFDDVPDYRV